jgi:hypothetical protein
MRVIPPWQPLDIILRWPWEHSSGRTLISRDGKTMTTTAKGTDANGAAMAVTVVYEMQQR